MTKRKPWLAIIIALCMLFMLMTGCAVEDTGNHESWDIDDTESENVAEQEPEEKAESTTQPVDNEKKDEVTSTETTKAENKDEDSAYDVEGLVFVGKYFISTKEAFGGGVSQYIFYDPETLILYSYMEKGDAGGFLEMHNSDGTPRLYNPN